MVSTTPVSPGVENTITGTAPFFPAASSTAVTLLSIFALAL